VGKFFFIFVQSNLLGCNIIFTSFWKLHNHSLKASNGAVFHWYVTLFFFSQCPETCFIWNRISLQETEKNSADAKSVEKGGWQIHAAIRQEALHYHVRMSREFVVEKEPTALLRKPKISRTLSVFESAVLGRQFWPKMEEFREKKCVEKRWMLFAVLDILVDCHIREMRWTVHIARISPVHHSESYYTRYVTIAVL